MPLFDLSGTIARLGGQTVTITRRAMGTYVDGRYVPAATSTFDIEGSIQPLSMDELENLPEGQRTKETRKLYTTSLLQVEKDPDHAAYLGRNYEVQGIDEWQPQGNYRKYLLVQVEGN